MEIKHLGHDLNDPNPSEEDMAEEIPVEEFENDTQDFLEEFMKKFPDEDFENE